MRALRSVILFSSLIGVTLITSCERNGDFLVFSVQNDVDLGETIAEQIAEDPSFDILSPQQYPVSYAYVQSMMDEILESEEVTYKEDFSWKINIINDPSNGPVLNAFATPGGQIYVHTGLIYFLDKEDDLAGVLSQEIAHADQRHVSTKLQREYGISLLLNVISGSETSSLERIVSQIAGSGSILPYSRDAEAEADEYSVRYLASTQYACNGAADFFEKLLRNEEQFQPEYLNTHPSPENRVEDINAFALSLGCDTTIDDNSALRYVNFRNSLP